jgi:hypothetical protein
MPSAAAQPAPEPEPTPKPVFAFTRDDIDMLRQAFKAKMKRDPFTSVDWDPHRRLFMDSDF